MHFSLMPLGASPLRNYIFNTQNYENIEFMMSFYASLAFEAHNICICSFLYLDVRMLNRFSYFSDFCSLLDFNISAKDFEFIQK